MNIGLDARTIFAPQPRGTGRNLFDAYRLLPALRPHWRFTLYHQRAVVECPLGMGGTPVLSAYNSHVAHHRWPDNVRTRRLDVRGDRWDAWFQLALPLAAWWDGVDLLHFPANAAPAWCPVPFVVTVHDLIPLRVADEFPPTLRARFRRDVARAVRRAAHIITPSQSTRADLCTEFGVSPQRVTVIPWAPDSSLLRAARGDGHPAAVTSAVEIIRRKYRLGARWVLNFSGQSARKNAPGLIAAIARLPVELQRAYRFVLIGCNSDEWRARLERHADSLGVAGACRILGFVPPDDLPGLLYGAAAVLIPSLYEGFGLPVLDAMACGVPVLASRRGSLPEVGGDAVLYCDPAVPDGIAAGIEQVLRPEVARRLVRRGLTRAAEFTWAKTAAAMCAVYERCGVARSSRLSVERNTGAGAASAPLPRLISAAAAAWPRPGTTTGRSPLAGRAVAPHGRARPRDAEVGV